MKTSDSASLPVYTKAPTSDVITFVKAKACDVVAASPPTSNRPNVLNKEAVSKMTENAAAVASVTGVSKKRLPSKKRLQIEARSDASGILKSDTFNIESDDSINKATKGGKLNTDAETIVATTKVSKTKKVNANKMTKSEVLCAVDENMTAKKSSKRIHERSSIILSSKPSLEDSGGKKLKKVKM